MSGLEAVMVNPHHLMDWTWNQPDDTSESVWEDVFTVV